MKNFPFTAWRRPGFYKVVWLIVTCFPLWPGCVSSNLQADTAKAVSDTFTGRTNSMRELLKYRDTEYLNLGPATLTFYGPGAVYDHPNPISRLSDSVCLFRKLKTLNLMANNLRSLPELACLDSLHTLNLAFNQQLHIRKCLPVLLRMPALNTLVLIGTVLNEDDLVMMIEKWGSRVKIVHTPNQFQQFLMPGSKQ